MNKLFYILIIVFLVACTTGEKDDTIVATVYGENLYISEIDLDFSDVSFDDSVLLVNRFVNRWVHEQTILHKANVSNNSYGPSNDDIEKNVESYRNSLIIYEFEKKYVYQNLDTIVKYEEVETFYEANKQEFKLNDDIVQIAYVKLLSDSKNLKQLIAMFKTFEEEDRDKIKQIADIEAENFLLDTDTWIVFDELFKEIPLNIKNRNQYLQKDKFIEIKDTLYTYLLRVNNYKIRDNYSPLNYEYDRIQKIIVNMRKMDMIEKLHNDIFEQAQEEGKIRIY